MSAIVLPRVMRIGAGALDEVPAALAQLGLSAPVILTDEFLSTSGALDRLLAILVEAGITTRAYSGVLPDPSVASVDKAVAFVAEGTHDCVIGFGGGSAIDTAKAVAVLVVRGGTMRALKAPHQENMPGLPIVAVPPPPAPDRKRRASPSSPTNPMTKRCSARDLPICPRSPSSTTNSR